MSIWLGVGGNPESALRAGELGLPVILANISQPPANFVSQIAAYRQRHAERGHDASTLKVAIATHVHVAKDFQTALDEFYPHYSAYFREHAPRANLSGEVSRDVYEKRAGPSGPILVGSPQQIIDKLMYERELFAHDSISSAKSTSVACHTRRWHDRSNCSQRKCCRQYVDPHQLASIKFVDETSARSSSCGAKV